MIIINKNATNEVVLTLNEKILPGNPIPGVGSPTSSYLLFLKNETTFEEITLIINDVYFTGADINERFNLFYIVEESIQSPPVNNSVHFPNSNTNWRYTVYHQLGDSNLDITSNLILNTLEIGRLHVNGEDDISLEDIYK